MLIRRLQNHPLANRYTASYAAAVLLHLLLLLLLTPARELLIQAGTAPVEPNSLAFEFVESEAKPSEAPEDSRFLSDRDARSADRSQADLLRSEMAQNEGIIDIQGDFQTSKAAGLTGTGQHSPDQTQQAEGETSEAEQIYQGLESMALLKRRGLTTREQRERSVFGSPAAARQSVAVTHLNSRALDEGGLQLSTYAWNFAPYLKYLKKLIQSHIFPPAAFTRLGIIDGESKVRFRIYADGRMEALEVLDSRGSKLLLQTSTQAVELSAPFKPLPDDFPEPFLEITGIFTYVLLGEGR